MDEDTLRIAREHVAALRVERDPDELITEHGTIFVPVDPDAMPASAGAAPEDDDG